QTARADADSALSARVDTVQAKANGNAAALQTEQTARADADSALSTRVDAVQASANDNAAAIQTEQTARASADESLASLVNTVQTQLNGQIASVQQSAEATANKLGDVAAQYVLKVDVNGRVIGFGLYNDGASGEFGIRADRFYIASPDDSEGLLPFVFSDGVLYLNEAAIGAATIDTLNLKDGAVTLSAFAGSNGFQRYLTQGNFSANAGVDVFSTLVVPARAGDMMNVDITCDINVTDYNSTAAAAVKIMPVLRINGADARSYADYLPVERFRDPISGRVFLRYYFPATGTFTAQLVVKFTYSAFTNPSYFKYQVSNCTLSAFASRK
ncbi:hypothetical protein ACKC9G_18410, partial [Pokkaliibacter sp. CJK22405]|uniref:phage tail tip fiber protein n=1 Tax=Pokkaliibacter sp. CJK22405 TaxID=3384615 RepID=UPI0039855269